MEIRPVADDEWEIVGWLWQCYLHDLSEFRGTLPLADGRFTTDRLDRARREGTAYVGWHHESPVAFSLVTRADGAWHMLAFFVVRGMRRSGAGRTLALGTIGRHAGPWEIAFQEQNPSAARFWRDLADDAFPGGWREERRPVPGKPEIPHDVWILST